MPKIDMTDLANLQNETTAVTRINANQVLAENAFDQVLFRKGTPSETDNAMEVDLDMNSQRIINLPEPVADTEPARKVDLGTFLDDAEDAAVAAAASATAADASADAAAASATAATTAETNAETAEVAAEAAQAAAEVAQAAAEAAASSVEFPTLDEVSDVVLTAVATGDHLEWDGDEWRNVNDVVTSDDINSIVSLTQVEYDALTPDANTLYLIEEA